MLRIDETAMFIWFSYDFSLLMYMENNMLKAMIKLRDLFEKCWCEQTIWRKNEFDSERLSAGQCYVTSLVLYDIFGGDLISAEIFRDDKYQSHYWFRLPDGMEFDLTSDQFDGDGIHTLPEKMIYERWIVRKPLNIRNKRALRLKQKIVQEFFRNV